MVDTTTNHQEEQEWIEAPGGWDGNDETLASPLSSSPKKENNGKNENENENEEEISPLFDLFADADTSFDFPFDVTITTYNRDYDYDGDARNKKIIVRKKRLYLSGYKLNSDETAQSTGVTLWSASPRLAKYIQSSELDNSSIIQSQSQSQGQSNNEHMNMNIQSSIPNEYIIGKNILELGAGLGLIGIVAHHLGARRVMMTDADTITLGKMRYNVKQNCCSSITTTSGSDNYHHRSSSSSSIDCRQLIWNEQLESFHNTHGNFETILGADVIYTKESLEPLFDTAAFFLIQLQNQNDDRNYYYNRNKSATTTVTTTSSEGQQQGRFILSRYNKWGGISDEAVLDVAKSRNFIWTQPSEGIFVFQLN